MSSLWTMVLVIGVLLLIVRGSASTRSGRAYRARKDLNTLRLYDMGNGLLGPLVATLLLLWALLEGSTGLLTLSVCWGVSLGILNRSELAWRSALPAVAGTAVLVEGSRVLMFVLAPHETGLLATLVKTMMVLLITVSFLLGAALSPSLRIWLVPKKVPLATKMLSYVVILEILMLFGEPVFETFLLNPSLAMTVWALLPFGVAGLVGFFSYPITLDLLSVGLAIALWSVVPEPPLAPIAGALAGLGTRAVVGRITGG